MPKSITTKSVESLSNQLHYRTENHAVIQRAVTSNGIYTSSENNFLSATNTTIFSNDIELSETYPYFWDKLEKSNTFYEHIIESAHAPIDDRRVEDLLNNPQGDS